jgi:hypothetical protein
MVGAQRRTAGSSFDGGHSPAAGRGLSRPANSAGSAMRGRSLSTLGTAVVQARLVVLGCLHRQQRTAPGLERAGGMPACGGQQVRVEVDDRWPSLESPAFEGCGSTPLVPGRSTPICGSGTTALPPPSPRPPTAILFGGLRYCHSVTAHAACGIAASDRPGVVLAGVLTFPLAGNRIGRIMLTLTRAARRAEHSRHLPSSGMQAR